MRAVLALFSGICFLVATQASHAWNKAGHMASAAIAYADLKERNPAVLAKVVEALKQHPHFKSEWAPKLEQVSADDRDLYLFVLAAKWPDDVRKRYLEYDRPKWHTVSIPYRPGAIRLKIPRGENILTAFPKNRSIVKSATADKEARAVALCWMLHLIGDVHQPLHTAKLVTHQFPEPDGDRGGSKFYVRVSPESSPIKFHGFWDDLVIGSGKFENVRKRATALMNKPGLKREDFAAELGVRSFKDWAVASYHLATKRAYLDEILRGADKDRGVVLSKDYTDQAKAVAERQVVLSGYRIRDAMVDVFGR